MKYNKHIMKGRLFFKLFMLPLFLFAAIILWGNICIAKTVNTSEKDMSTLDTIDYIIVLGNKMNHDVPSKLLLNRLNGAIELLEKHPESTAVVTGGILGNNTSSEAEVMKEYLIEHGIDSKRIILEQESQNTRQNFSYTKQLIPETCKIVIITNGFHMYRSLNIAKELGYTNVYGYPVSDGSLWSSVKNRLVESFTIFYNYIVSLFV